MIRSTWVEYFIYSPRYKLQKCKQTYLKQRGHPQRCAGGNWNAAMLGVFEAYITLGIGPYTVKANLNGTDASQRPAPQFPRAIRSDDHAEDKAIVVNALGRLNEHWTRSSPYNKEKDKLMPFLPSTEFHSSKPYS